MGVDAQENLGVDAETACATGSEALSAVGGRNGPVLSIVVATRNDGFGDRQAERVAAHARSVDEFANVIGDEIEHVVVEWAPLVGWAPLTEILPPVRSQRLVRRIVHAEGPEVNAVNERYGRTFHETAAKNVGVRRARGQYIMITNQDIMLTKELAWATRQWLDSGLAHRTFARCDRLDVHVDEAELFPTLTSVSEALARRRAIHSRPNSHEIGAKGLKQLLSNLTRPVVKHENIEKYLFMENETPLDSFYWLHTNASGDCLLVSRTALLEADCLAEGIPWRSHLDSFCIYRLWGTGLGQVVLRFPAVAVHVNHTVDVPHSPDWSEGLPYVQPLLEGRPYPNQPQEWGVPFVEFLETLVMAPRQSEGHVQTGRSALPVGQESSKYDGPRMVLDGGNYLYLRRVSDEAPDAVACTEDNLRGEPQREGVAELAGNVAPQVGEPRCEAPAGEPLSGIRQGSKNVIAFSLYGSYLTYLVGAIMNAQLAPRFYPEFVCRFYYTASVPRWVLEILGRFDHVELVDMTERAHEYGSMFWRFLAAADPDVDVYLCRDADSRFSARERAAVDEWLVSGQRFHIMRDHPMGHGNPIVGCMWGCRGGALRDIEQLIRDSGPHEDRYGADEQFLWDVVYPRAVSSMMVHDEHYAIEPVDFPFRRRFPVPPDHTGQFVGQALDEEGNDRHAHEFV